MTRAARQSMIRKINDELVCRLLRTHGTLSRARIAALAQVTVPAALKMINRLVAAGLVISAGEGESSRPGPKASLFRLSDDYGIVTGVNVIAKRLDVCHRTLTGNLVEAHAVDFDPSSDIAAQIVEASCSPWRDRPQSLVVGLPGTVDPGSGDVTHAIELPGWPAGGARAVREASGAIRIAFDNEVNLRAEAERSTGVARDQADFLLLSLGSGVGAALVLEGAIRRGFRGAAGEVGFMISNQQPGLRRYQDVAGAWELAHVVGMEHDVDFAWARMLAAEKADDPAPWDAIAAAISPSVLSMAAIVDPGLIVLAGELARIAGAPLREAVERWFAMNAELDPPVFAVSDLGDEAVLQGAFLCGWQLLLDAALSRPVPSGPDGESLPQRRMWC